MEEVQEVWRQYKKNKTQAMTDELVKRYLYLVKYVAGRVAIGLPQNIEVGDLVSYGILGLYDAISKFDVEQGNKFETYAVQRVRGAIMDELRRLDWAPRLLRKKAKDIEKVCRVLEEKLGRTPTDEELATEMGVSVSEVSAVYSDLNATSLLSLDEVWEHDDGNKPISRMQTIGNSFIPSHVSELQKQEAKEIIVDTLKQLAEKERLVMVLYYYENLTLKEIGSVLDVSESRVCQIHTKVIIRLRSSLSRRMEDIYMEA